LSASDGFAGEFEQALAPLFDAIDRLLISESSDGCTDDLTVVSLSACAHLRQCNEDARLRMQALAARLAARQAFDRLSLPR
jgi:hypothetical protein